MKNFALAFALFVGMFFLIGVSSPVQAQCGISPDPSNTCTGSFSGFFMTTGTVNSMYGSSAGENMATGSANSFFGSLSGTDATATQRNAFFGAYSGRYTLGNRNTFFGTQAGGNNVAGSNNAFFGDASGVANITGTYITAFGRGSDVGSDGLSFASAFGAGAIVTASNTIQLGRDTFDTVRIGKMGAAGATPLCLNANKELSTCAPIMMAKSENTDELKFEIRKQNRIISEQADALRAQQGQIEALRNTLCSMNSKAAICRQ